MFISSTIARTATAVMIVAPPIRVHWLGVSLMNIQTHKGPSAATSSIAYPCRVSTESVVVSGDCGNMRAA